MNSPATPLELKTPKVEENGWSAIIIGTLTLLVFFGLFGGWAATAPLHSAALAKGIIVVESNRRMVRHVEGGVVSEILVKDGDSVEAGQTLLRLDDSLPAVNLAIADSQYKAMLALESRLIAERDGLPAPVYPDSLTDPQDEEARQAIDGQTKIFQSRRKILDGQIDILRSRNVQYEKLIAGLDAQIHSLAEQSRLILEELEGVRELYEQGYEKKPRLLALQRSAADLGGEMGRLTEEVAKTKLAMSEIDLRVIDLRNTFVDGVVRELRDTQTKLADTAERKKAAESIVQRIDIKAPDAGTIVNLQVHTLGSAVQPGEPLLEIVPRDVLIVEVMLKPEDIDDVQPGFEAVVNLTAYKQRVTPTLRGKVASVSADSITGRDGVRYYLCRIEVSKEEMGRYSHVKLTPGMPADVMIQTGARTALDYLIGPLNLALFQAMREP